MAPLSISLCSRYDVQDAFIKDYALFQLVPVALILGLCSRTPCDYLRLSLQLFISSSHNRSN